MIAGRRSGVVLFQEILDTKAKGSVAAYSAYQGARSDVALCGTAT